ncbi:Polycystic kidney disease protein 1-like 2 [Argiope bruennichi]|uniref:Polycystic kidney disease protein 1-like 2 n=1 Tax=Argiope bruennichi TaxID=94029 RepID=A0A8T0EHB0_ARGBR|nr:Polycystic kidney disease protein 1-like 2 [Argiope bruennichi]
MEHEIYTDGVILATKSTCDTKLFFSDVIQRTCLVWNRVYSVLFGAAAEEGSDFFFAVGHLTDTSAQKIKKFQDGQNLTRDDMTNEYSDGYSIALYTTGCYFFSEETSAWSSEGCKVHSSHSNRVCCHCNHLTMFGSGFLIAPNKIDFSYVFANAGFEDNLIIYLSLIISLCLFIILAIWCRWKDKKDLTKLGATPLPDNDIQDKYFYEILVQTGYQFNAGTKSKICFIISGEDDETDVRVFADDQRPIFQRGAINCFIMSVPRCLGQLNYLRIWHDNSGEGKNASWYLKHVVVKDIITGYKYEFIAERWFAVEEGDGLIDHLIPVAGKEQMTEFSHLFPNASRRSLTDNHLWLSVFTRPARSRFTRLQRLSCCLAILYLSMLTSAMWYETTPEQPSPGAFKFGPLSLSPEQIAVGLMSNLIVFPPSFVMIILFRKSRARELRPSHVNVALEKQYEKWRKTYGLSMDRKLSKMPATEMRRPRPSVDEEAHSGRPSKKKCLLPWWCAHLSWCLVILSVASSVFFLWAYGLQFGNIRTGKWLTSMVISLLSSVLLTEPLKIFLIAIIMACLCGNPDVDDDDSDDDEQDPYLKEDEECSILSIPALYYGNRDPNSFYLREATINNFIKPGDLWVDFNNVNNEVKFWNWTRNALIPELFAGLWYNGRPPLGLRLLADDRNNFKIGYPVLRQVRARTDSCTVPDVMTDIIFECAGYGNLINENGAIYSKFWSTNLTMASRIPPEYKYMTASDLNGFPFWGQLDWYGGGGYVVPLIAKRYEDGVKLIERMEELEQTGWINKDTRAVFVEFGTYNAQVNLFVVTTIVAEFLPGGGILPYYHIDPIRLLHYHTGSGLLQLVCQIGFVLFTLYYTVLVLRAFCREGREYFSQYWNIAELWNVLASWAVIGVEIYKMIITQRVLAIFTATEGTGYIKLQEALLLDEAFCYLIGFLMSLATLKFLKLLRFNKRIGGMIATVRLCAKELKGYGVCLIITFLAFVTLFWLTLGRAVREFCSFISSFESSISMLLKKFNYYDMEQASSIIGPLAFFTFALTASVVLINILLTIIIQAFEEVKHDIQFQNSDYELMDFIMRRLRLFFGRTKDHTRIVPITFAATANKKTDVMDSFNGKVDRLLDFINSVYLDEQIDMEFLNKARNQIPLQTLNQEQLERKKSRPRKIPRYQPLHVKKHLDF